MDRRSLVGRRSGLWGGYEELCDPCEAAVGSWRDRLPLQGHASVGRSRVLGGDGNADRHQQVLRTRIGSPGHFPRRCPFHVAGIYRPESHPGLGLRQG